jgi:hypothetical protein
MLLVSYISGLDSLKDKHFYIHCTEICQPGHSKHQLRPHKKYDTRKKHHYLEQGLAD